ncbi:MAG: cyclic nucleotide-binding domain-containing protein, partial [Rhodospirillales bacterium]|nr:cyclic nucleotide-binding domain-containing protein [Rhodospirillales bacterium]
TTFQEFSPVEFMKLMRLASWKEIPEDNFIAKEGEEFESLKLLYNGEVKIVIDGKEVARARDGAMIGEISFLQGGNATATVQAAQPCRCVVWPKEELRSLLKRNPTMDIAMKHIFSMDLTRKLLGDGGPEPLHV